MQPETILLTIALLGSAKVVFDMLVSLTLKALRLPSREKQMEMALLALQNLKVAADDDRQKLEQKLDAIEKKLVDVQSLVKEMERKERFNQRKEKLKKLEGQFDSLNNVRGNSSNQNQRIRQGNWR